MAEGNTQRWTIESLEPLDTYNGGDGNAIVEGPMADWPVRVVREDDDARSALITLANRFGDQAVGDAALSIWPDLREDALTEITKLRRLYVERGDEITSLGGRLIRLQDRVGELVAERDEAREQRDEATAERVELAKAALRAGERRDKAIAEMNQFVEHVTRELNALGCPATPSWPEAFAWLRRQLGP